LIGMEGIFLKEESQKDLASRLQKKFNMKKLLNEMSRKTFRLFALTLYTI